MLEIISLKGKLHLVPGIIFCGLIMLIVYPHGYGMPFSEFAWSGIRDDTIIWDFFSFYKMLGLIFTTVFAAILFAALELEC